MDQERKGLCLAKERNEGDVVAELMEPLEDRIVNVIDDLFGHRRTRYGYLSPMADDDDLLVLGLEILREFGVRNPEEDTPWIKEFMHGEQARLGKEALQSEKKSD
jgi:hypothetical protein